MRKLAIALCVTSLIFFSACKSNEPYISQSLSTHEGDSSLISSIVPDTESEMTEAAQNTEVKYGSTIEILPERAEIPLEIADVLYDGKPFNYVFYAWPSNYEEERIPRESMQVSIKDFAYDAYIDVLEDGSLDIIKYNVQWKKYAVLDLDNDGTNELIYYAYPGGNGFYVIFHVIDGEVYGYSELYRDVSELYKDGTIVGESGASWFWIKKITAFDKTGYSEEILARQEDDYYTISDKEVTAVEFCNYTAKWNQDNGELAVEWVSEHR